VIYCKLSHSATAFPNAYIERQQITAKVAQPVCRSKNIRRRLTPTQSNRPVKIGGLTRAVEQHLGASDIITNRRMLDETSIPVSKIFDHFRNMTSDKLQSNFVIHRGKD
ncbi:hypothetical protein Tco_1454649, partial [Tanacetum coccineum]